MAETDDLLAFIEDEPGASGLKTAFPPWRIFVVDDDADIHEATRFALRDMVILDRPLVLLHAHSAAAALALLAKESDIAVILLDVVMETTTAGLDMIEHLRTGLGRMNTRIILRTGQPGHAPEIDTVRKYDINDYHTKSELTRNRLFVALSNAIRAYDQLERAAATRHFLERVVLASDHLIAQPTLLDFSRKLLGELAELLATPLEGIVCIAAPECSSQKDCRVIATTARHTQNQHRKITEIDDPVARDKLQQCIDAGVNLIEAHSLTLHLPATHPLRCLVAHVTASTALPPLDGELFDMFCSNAALGAEKVALNERLHSQAYFDDLVALPNRHAFIEALDIRLAQDGGRGFVLALLDVDQFAEINDMFGHGYADRLLQAIARRLEGNMNGHTVIARVGTDTFGLLSCAEHLTPERLSIMFATPFVLDSSEHIVSVAIGLVRLQETHGGGADSLKDASIAVKHAKARGQGQVAWFTPAIGHETRERTRLLHALREAYNYDRLFPVYQPQVCLETGRIIGFEALMRWRTAEGKFVPPDAFIPVAENSGLVVGLGTWILRMALRAAGDLQQAGLEGFHMAVNVSVVQFRQPDFLATLDAALLETGINPENLELEITESVAMMGAESIVGIFSALKQRGIALAIDDFGTGFSSLAYLDQLPADRIKIDRSFVTALETGQRGARIAEMVIPLGRKLGMKVLAEGVENDWQAARLKELGCDEGQGYLYARPMPLPDVLQWVKARLENQP